MNRRVDDKNILDEFAEMFCGIVDKHAKYIVVSGFVAIAHGRSRGTEDIDMILENIPFERFRKLHDELVREGFICVQSSNVLEIYDYLKRGDSIRYVDNNELMPPEMEVKFAKDEIDRLQLATRRKLEFTGLNIWFSSIEMNIAFKEELLRSDKDMEDARHLRKIYEDKIDEKEIEEIKKMIRRIRLG